MIVFHDELKRPKSYRCNYCNCGVCLCVFVDAFRNPGGQRRVSNKDAEPVLVCGCVSNPSAHNTDTFKGERVGCLRGFLQT